MYNDNDNDNDLFGDFCSNDQLYGSENNPTTNNDNNPNAYNFSQMQSDQIKELGLDDIDSTSDEDDVPKTSSNVNQSNKTNQKRKLSSESENVYDNDYDGDLIENRNDTSKNLIQFSDNLAQDNANNSEFNKNENINDLSFTNNNSNNNANNNNNNDLSLNEDFSENSKDRKELSNKAKEKLQFEREKTIRKKRMEQQEEDNKKMQVLMANFSDEQLNRYEIFRRSAFPKANVKRIIQTVCGKSVAPDVIIAMSGMAKVFIGEIVETALDIQQKTTETGPLHPKHIREAFRIYKKSEKRSATYKHKKPSVLL